MKKVSAILKSAKKLIKNESAWTKGTEARDETGHSASPKSEEAVCWCALGACWAKADGMLDALLAIAALSKALNCQGGRPSPTHVGRFNDRHSHKKVLALFDEAIAIAVEAEKG